MRLLTANFEIGTPDPLLIHGRSVRCERWDGRAWRPVPRNRACVLAEDKREGSKESDGGEESMVGGGCPAVGSAVMKTSSAPLQGILRTCWRSDARDRYLTFEAV